MVSRSNTSKTIRRRTGGTGTKPTLTARQAMSGEIGSHKRTNVRDATVGGVRGTINRPGDWEMVPGTGTSPYNPPKWRKKKKPDTKVTKEDSPPPKDYEGGRGAAHRKQRKKEDDLIKRIASDPNFGAKAGGKVSKSKGGTVKKRKGGTPKRKYSKGGSVSRRGGGKIMIGYKAGGKV